MRSNKSTFVKSFLFHTLKKLNVLVPLSCALLFANISVSWVNYSNKPSFPILTLIHIQIILLCIHISNYLFFSRLTIHQLYHVKTVAKRLMIFCYFYTHIWFTVTINRNYRFRCHKNELFLYINEIIMHKKYW